MKKTIINVRTGKPVTREQVAKRFELGVKDFPAEERELLRKYMAALNNEARRILRGK